MSECRICECDHEDDITIAYREFYDETLCSWCFDTAESLRGRGTVKQDHLAAACR